METLETTKLRLIRDAVRENTEDPPPAAVPPPARRHGVPAAWLVAALLMGTLVYLAAPSQVASRGIAAPGVTPPAAHAAAPVAAVEEALHPQPPRSVPRALDPSVLPLGVKTVVLDPGHGGRQQGAVSESGVKEKDITLDIARRLRRMMMAAGFGVIMTREADEEVSLEQRVKLANAAHADLFVSIHVNWLPTREVRPLETYYLGATDDPTAIRLARVENQDSGYGRADYRRLLEGIYLDSRRDESYALAHRVNGELHRALSPVIPGLRNRGVKTAPFVVLIGTEMPAILVEISSLSNADDVELLTSADYRDQVAGALLRGVRSYAHRVASVSRNGG